MENKQEKALGFIAYELHRAVAILASRCDGARSENGQGFSRFDTEWGHTLARDNPMDWNTTYCKKVRKMLTKYRGQLERSGFLLDDVPELPGSEVGRQVHFEPDFGGQFVLTLNYDDPQFSEVLRAIKSMERRFWRRERKAWVVPSDQAGYLAELVKEWEFKPTEVASHRLKRAESLQPQRQPAGVVEYLGEDRVAVSFGVFDKTAVTDLKRTFPVDNRRWRTDTPFRHWEIDLKGAQADGLTLCACLVSFAERWRLTVSDAAKSYLLGEEKSCKDKAASMNSPMAPEPERGLAHPWQPMEREQPTVPMGDTGDLDDGETDTGWSAESAIRLFE